MFKKFVSAAMAATICMSGAAIANLASSNGFGFTSITASAAFQSYTIRLEVGTKIYTSPTSGVSNSTITVGTLYTIVDEQTVGNNVFGKLKSGAGWVIVRQVSNVPYTKYLELNTPIYTSPTSGVSNSKITVATYYTIVEERTVGTVKYGRLKSGAGWVIVEGQPIPPVQDYLIPAYTNNLSKIIAVGRQTVSGPCAAYALAYCRTMLDGRTHSYTEYYDGNQCWWNWGNYTPLQNYTSKLAAYQKAYDLLKAGQPVIFRLTGSYNCDHYVTAVGYRKNANRSNLTANDFYIIDPARPSSELNTPAKLLSGNDLRLVDGKYKIVVKA